MLTDRPSNDGAGYGPPSQRSLFAAMRGAIGEALGKQYETSAQLPRRLLALVRRLEDDTKRGDAQRDQ
jgi:hypothetical protein